MLLQFSSDILNFQNSKIYKFNLKIPKSLFTNMPKYKMIEMVAEACLISMSVEEPQDKRFGNISPLSQTSKTPSELKNCF